MENYQIEGIKIRVAKLGTATLNLKKLSEDDHDKLISLLEEFLIIICEYERK